MTHEEFRHELQHLKLGRRALGYDRKAVDMLLERLAASFEELSGATGELDLARRELRATMLERDELRMRVAELQDGSGTSRELGALVRNTLVSAQRAANELRHEARREANEMLVRARNEMARAVSDARSDALLSAERKRLDEECRRLTIELQRIEAEFSPAEDPVFFETHRDAQRHG